MPAIDVEKTAFGATTDALTVGHWEVVERAEDRLRNSAYRELRNVFCSFREGILTLRGRVSSYYMKQLAQALVAGLGDVRELNNQLEVVE
jgi:hypothetical protein